MIYIYGPLKWIYFLLKPALFWLKPSRQTDTSYKDYKLITAVCGYCNHSMEQNDFNRWLGNHHTAPNKIVFKESLVGDRISRIKPDLKMEWNVRVPRWSTQYQSPFICKGCGETIQNTYAMKIMEILVVVFY